MSVKCAGTDVCLTVTVVLSLTLVLTTGSRAPVENREKRSDDAGALQTVVDDLAQKINVLSAQLAQQANSYAAQLSQVNSELVALRNVTQKLDQKVAFQAWSSHNPLTAAPHGTLVMEHAALNTGQAYSPLTGVFTAPVSGLYHLQASLTSYHPGRHVYAAIYVDNKQVARGLSDSDLGDYSQTSISALVHLQGGQKAMVRNTENAVKEYLSSDAEPFTAFSGFLISAD